MPTFIRPAKVVVTEDSGGLAAVAGLAALAAVTAAASAIITDVLTAILITLVALALAGTGVLAILLRRDGLHAPLPPAPGRAPAPELPAATATAITAPLAIEAPKTGPLSESTVAKFPAGGRNATANATGDLSQVISLAIEAPRADTAHLTTGHMGHRSAPADLACPAPLSPRITRSATTRSGQPGITEAARRLPP